VPTLDDDLHQCINARFFGFFSEPEMMKKIPKTLNLIDLSQGLDAR
jgi:hypothetical protein